MAIPGFGWLQSIILYKLGRRPLLNIELRATGGSVGVVEFVATVSNGGPLAALSCELTVDLEGLTRVYKQTLNLGAGEIDRTITFTLERPKYGDLMSEANHATTLYGRALVARISSGQWGASDRWDEEIYDPVTDAGRAAVQQAAWERGRPLAGA